MLAMRDCLDYCDLTEDTVSLFAEHEHIPEEIAGPLICGLVQTDDGVEVLCACLSDLVSDAITHGALEKAQHVLQVYAEFRATHPQTLH
ncbi:MAG: hypothetical protein CGU28_14925 [Candidatus Dactylopiibacterium carminicum]|uniref:Uncharacterized protein n=1 Tax=Candidatus Dactylopiibacterium carminicum TaxID=857335 RepID=A0A272EPM5_9RHOO|nr:hypothetical protein [Candidatus Dactylopiibacterium carminicum]KAF7598061.1 hypothetical protein BGI27_15260 [Candidatus Dactylopiibacterium carminicum]PAS91640.1 MAG: hypothetical protein CGU29_15405 [Candidatus Dactylopiibacterium carminicum]PAS93600.1 MAG: hypothetical protein CGU28_14925 [Candidatus Dactylopiibacterium carminicum]PAS96502.1 MAG: hypothetical protein BSR46_15305 [Candidatus Dactylopiibacterium carminicum]